MNHYHTHRAMAAGLAAPSMPMPTEAQQSEIPAELQSLAVAAGALQDALDDLSQRLNPVIRPCNVNESKGPDGPRPVLSPVAEQISLQVERMQSMHTQVRRITDALAI